MSTLKQAFDILLTRLNTLSPNPFPNKISLTPKHPDYIEADQEFPYFAIAYAGEIPEYEDSDVYWSQPSREMASFKIWLVLAQSESDSLSADLMAIVKQVRTLVKALTLDRTACDFRVRVDDVGDVQYEPSGRWALAVVTVTIGAYDS